MKKIVATFLVDEEVLIEKYKEYHDIDDFSDALTAELEVMEENGVVLDDWKVEKEKGNTDKIYTVTITSRSDYDFSVTMTKHGAFRNYIDAVIRLMEVVRKSIDSYWQSAKSKGYALEIMDDCENGYWKCWFGEDEDYELHQICIDEYEIEE